LQNKQEFEKIKNFYYIYRYGEKRIYFAWSFVRRVYAGGFYIITQKIGDCFMNWLNNIPAKRTKDGRLMLLPANNEPTKLVKEITPNFKKIARQRIASKFAGVLS